jgi:hypothetical protein
MLPVVWAVALPAESSRRASTEEKATVCFFMNRLLVVFGVRRSRTGFHRPGGGVKVA